MKTAFVLSGGGAKGSFQVGVIKKLIRDGINPDAIYGTSVGAINACGYAYGGIPGLEQSWLEVKGRKDILKLNWWKLLWAKGLFSLSPLRKILKKVIKNPNTLCEAIVCQVSLTSGEIVYSRSSETAPVQMVEAVLASSAIPLLMEPIGEMVDGGAREMTPLKQAILDGYEKIVVILANPYRKLPAPWSMPKGLFQMFKIMYRGIDGLLEHEVFYNDIEDCLFYNKHAEYLNKKKIDICVYAPDRLLLETQEYDPVKIRLAMEQGWRAAPVSFDELFNKEST